MPISVCAHGGGGGRPDTAWPEISVTTPTATGGGEDDNDDDDDANNSQRGGRRFRHKNALEFGAFKYLANKHNHFHKYVYT